MITPMIPIWLRCYSDPHSSRHSDAFPKCVHQGLECAPPPQLPYNNKGYQRPCTPRLGLSSCHVVGSCPGICCSHLNSTTLQAHHAGADHAVDCMASGNRPPWASSSFCQWLLPPSCSPPLPPMRVPCAAGCDSSDCRRDMLQLVWVPAVWKHESRCRCTLLTWCSSRVCVCSQMLSVQLLLGFSSK